MKQEITVAYKTTQTLKQLLDLKDNFEDFRKSRMYEILWTECDEKCSQTSGFIIMHSKEFEIYKNRQAMP